MVAASKFTVEVRINETHIEAGHPALMGFAPTGQITPDGSRAEALAGPLSLHALAFASICVDDTMGVGRPRFSFFSNLPHSVLTGWRRLTLLQIGSRPCLAILGLIVDATPYHITTWFESGLRESGLAEDIASQPSNRDP